MVRVTRPDQGPIEKARFTAFWGNAKGSFQYPLEIEWEGETEFYVDLTKAPWETETLEDPPDRYDLVMSTESHGTIQRELRCEDREVELAFSEPAHVTIQFTARLPESDEMNVLGLTIRGVSETNDRFLAGFQLDDVLVDGAAELGPLNPGRFHFYFGVQKYERAKNARYNFATLQVLGSTEAEIASGRNEIMIAPRER